MIKYSVEFPIKSSVKILFNALSTPSGLSEWFADDVNWKGNNYTFIWDDSVQEAELLKKINNYLVRFKWIDSEDDDTYFEFKIDIDSITNDVILVITGFSEDEEEKEREINLWNTQIQALMKSIGS